MLTDPAQPSQTGFDDRKGAGSDRETGQFEAPEPEPRGPRLSNSDFGPEPVSFDPERIAWDGSLTVAERRHRLTQRYREASDRLRGPHGPASLIEMQRILEAIQVLDARARREDDWAHFLRESAFA